MRSSATRGFTLVELLIVLVVIGLLTAVALPRLSGAQANAELQSSARQVAAALRDTRSLAMASGHAEIFLLDTAAGVFRSPAAQPVALPKGVRPVLFAATQDQRDAVTGGIRFFPDGSSTGGGVRLLRGNKTSEVLIDWLTGRISVAAR